MEGAESAALVADIKANGVRESIVVFRGQIVDGRNRFLAAQQLGIKCPTREYKGKKSELLAFVISANLHRRHLSESQYAMIAARIADMRQGERTDIEPSGNLQKVSRGQAAELFGVSPESVTMAKKVISTATPEVVKAVDGNQLAVSVAAQLADQPPEFQRRVVKKLATRAANSSAEALRQVRREDMETSLNSIEALEARALAGKYDVAVIDPPWPMDMIERDTRPEQVAWDYPVMDVTEIADEVGSNLSKHLAENAHVFLWTTQKFLPHAFSLLDQWGLAYDCTLVWHKPGGFQPFGSPQYNCEFVIHARKGSPQFLDTKDFPTCFGPEGAPRGRHSEKPELFYATLRRVTGGRRLDMYNRRVIDGFDGWGKETTQVQ